MNLYTRKTSSVITTASLLALLVGCGGGGGGSSATGISYTGSISPASLTTSNSGTMLGGGYLGGNSAAVIGGVTANLTNEDHTTRQPRTISLSQALTKVVRHINLSHLDPADSTSAALRSIPPDTLDGTCGGSANISGTYDDLSGEIDLAISFASYCEDGITLAGNTDVTGQAVVDSQSTVNISSLNITLSNLTTTHGFDSYTAKGSITLTPMQGYTYIENNVALTMDMLLKDNATAKVYRFEDFALTVASTIAATSYDDITLSGRYYDPDEGYIDFSTPNALHVIVGDEWPSSGAIRAAGNNSSATITALNNTSYQLEIDTDGDGTTDSTETGAWSSL